MFVLAGCAPVGEPGAGSTLPLIPATGASAASGALEVREYPLVEQSADNPVSVDFQRHVPAAVAAQRDGWHFPDMEDALNRSNQALVPFGFRLEPSSAPPFSSYRLLRGEEVVSAEIARFWPVSIKTIAGQNTSDFLLPYVTLDGEKQVASVTGIYPWPGAHSENTAPVYYGDKIAYAETHAGQLEVYAGPSLLYTAPETGASAAPGAGQPAESGTRSLHSWTRAGGAEQHWALELDGRLIIDGEEINATGEYEESFGFNLVNGEPFYFSTRDGISRITYNGRSLPYVYDQVVHDQGADLAVFNPGSNGAIVWFYALRDGLWYYVEAGNFE